MDRRPFCKHCNLVVAPGDPERVATNKAAAHKRCIMSHMGAQLIGMVYDFLRTHADQVVTDGYLDRMATSRDYDVFLRQTEHVLRRVYLVGEGPDKRRQRDVVDFAEQLGEHLLTKVDYTPVVEQYMSGINTGT